MSIAEDLPAPRAEPETYGVKFYGTASEYFGIWIVNVFLTIVTLGIYSAWAKVRRERYFYGNTEIAGHAFEYHARPVSILIGRALVLVILVFYSAVAKVFPLIQILGLIFFVFGLPWVVQRGLRFNARVSSYRNVRFDFVGSYWGAWKAYTLGVLVTLFSLGTLSPLASRWAAGYTVNNLRYGGRPFEGTWRLGAFYRVYLFPFIMGAVALAVIGWTLYSYFGNISQQYLAAKALGQEAPILVTAQFVLIGLIYLLIIIWGMAGILYRTSVRNLIFSGTVLDKRHAFRSDLSPGRVLWISVSNLVVAIVTVGLMRPWAAIRMARYQASMTYVLSTGDFEGYHQELSKATPGVTASQFLDIEGIDAGFGF